MNDDETRRVYVHPDVRDRLRSLGIALPIEAHPLVPRDQVLVFNPAALTAEFDVRPVLSEPDDAWVPTPAGGDALRRQLLLAEARLSVGLRRTVVESDPLERPMPIVLVRSWREVPSALWRVLRNHARRCRDIVGYERRKAAGELRRHPDPRDFAVIKGVDS